MSNKHIPNKPPVPYCQGLFGEISVSGIPLPSSLNADTIDIQIMAEFDNRYHEKGKWITMWIKGDNDVGSGNELISGLVPADNAYYSVRFVATKFGEGKSRWETPSDITEHIQTNGL